ncbi:hypothetical protein CANMA_001033 [Candida margitis]|uniref:uncharacterized protein n=1 Tax=Candida margitis TaxID=1775924 RepID=UPI002227C273|nr:uncharacterized protein CANMA_001033 [Candida margitis]KAI5969993.1 hypothetical protein CANMA_001033 [Candida margitis]
MVNYETSSFQVQGLASSISKRLSSETNSLLLNAIPTGRQAKRLAQQINYSEDFVDDFEIENSPSDLPFNGQDSGRNLNESKTQVDAQKYGPARNTPRISSLEDESNLNSQSNKLETLIPIKLNLESTVTSHKVNDIFVWNLNQTLVTPTDFAQILCNDLELPHPMIAQIADSITQQIEEYSYASNLSIPNKNPCNVIIDLSVNLNKQLYQDRIEWDLNQNEITPEKFAEIVVADLGLSLEFNLAISHALHEIIIRVKKEIIEGSFNNEIHNLHLVKGIFFEQGLRIFTESSVSNGNDRWEPSVEILSSSEIERRENERIRNLRRLKRENMRRDYDDNKRRNVGRRRRGDDDEWSPINYTVPVFLAQANPSLASIHSGMQNLYLQSPVLQPHSNNDSQLHPDSIIDDCHFMSFEEWKKQKIETNLSMSNSSRNITEPSKPSTNVSSTNVTAVSVIAVSEHEGTTYKNKFNFASADCAATIIKTNSQTKGASAILKENKDSYLLNKCSVENKFIIIELCQDILISQVVLGNYEFFSSMFKDIRVSVSDRFPTQNWRELGQFTAKNIRDVQTFDIASPLIWARYIKLEILSHYGNEFYCPISVVRVHGKTMIDEFKEDEEVSSQQLENQEQAMIRELDANDSQLETLINDTFNECSVVLPHLLLNEFLKDLNTSKNNHCLLNEGNSSGSVTSTTATIATTQESIYKNIIKRLTLLESNATLSLLYIEEQSKLLSTAFSNLEKRQSANFNNLLRSVNSTLLHQLSVFKDSYHEMYSQYSELFHLQDHKYKHFIAESNQRLKSISSDLTFQKRLSFFNSIIIICLLVYVILTRETNVEIQRHAIKERDKRDKPSTSTLHRKDKVLSEPARKERHSISDPILTLH